MLFPALRAKVRKQAACLPLHRGKVGDLSERERGLAHHEQSVRPRADQHDVGLLDRKQIGLGDLREPGDRPAFLAELRADHLGRLPRVAGEALDE